MKSDNAFAVALFGIPDFERELIDRIFSLSESRDNVYRSVDEAQNHTADIALVDTTNETGTDEFERSRSQRQDFPSVIIATGKDAGSDHRVKRPFTVMRMLGALDRLVEDALSGAERPTPAAVPVEIPDETVAPPPIEPVVSTVETPEEPTVTATGYTALVVDDSLPVRKQVSVALRRAGITAEFAEDAESALHLIETRSYDILFLDIVLPGKDGYEICKAVKKDKDKKHIPVVMLTGKASRFDRAKGKLSGCDAYMTKPVSLKEFNLTLSKWLNVPPSSEPTVDA
jgi:twitching motility two-component system response regulator PilG